MDSLPIQSVGTPAIRDHGKPSATPGTPECRSLDVLQSALAKLPQVKMELIHRFTPGLYIRELHVPAGTVTITKIHLTEHPFVVSKGEMAIWTDEGGIERISAPYCGITKPGTRRIIYHATDVVITTFHPTNETDPDVIESQIILDRGDEIDKIDCDINNTLSCLINNASLFTTENKQKELT